MRHNFENYVWNIGNWKIADSMKQSVSKLLVPSLENVKLNIKYLNISVEKAVQILQVVLIEKYSKVINIRH